MPVTGVGWQLGGGFTNYEIMFDISKSIALELGGGGGEAASSAYVTGT